MRTSLGASDCVRPEMKHVLGAQPIQPVREASLSRSFTGRDLNPHAPDVRHLFCTPKLTNRCRPYSTLPPRRFLFSFTVYQ